ncbi:MAG: metal-dependent hydrolase [Candidatus Acidiferrum sp.]
MDIATHALASYALARGFFPRRRWPVLAGIVFAGTIADVDLISAFFGPEAYFADRRTYTHSLFGTLVIVLLSALLASYLSGKQPEAITSLLAPLALAAAVHMVLDLFQSEGIALLWPFRPTRYAMDWLPPIDPWILAILIAGILLPEILRLVTSEIGAKNKSPRGRNGAIVALLVVAAYLGARGLLHSGSIATLEPHSYHGESARVVGAFPDALLLFTWHGVVETTSLLCRAEVPVGPGRAFDPESAECLYKPESSPELTAAQNTHAAQEFIRAVPFPRAVVAKTQTGYEVVIRSMRDLVEGETRHRVAALVQVDSNFAVSSQVLVWSTEIRIR